MPIPMQTHGFVMMADAGFSSTRDTITNSSCINTVAEGPLSKRAHMILLVDDDDDVRETAADMLAELGYGVIQASSGPQALKLLDECPDLELMVTDIRMPGMSGLELSDLAGCRRLDLKIILVSGYFLPQPITRRFVQKPFRTHELDEAIRAELAEG